MGKKENKNTNENNRKINFKQIILQLRKKRTTKKKKKNKKNK